MNKLEKMKLEVQLKQVHAARCELELRKEECLDQISKIEAHIKTQIQAEENLKLKIEGNN